MLGCRSIFLKIYHQLPRCDVEIDHQHDFPHIFPTDFTQGRRHGWTPETLETPEEPVFGQSALFDRGT